VIVIDQLLDTTITPRIASVIDLLMLVSQGVLVHDQAADAIKKSGMVMVDGVVAAQTNLPGQQLTLETEVDIAAAALRTQGMSPIGGHGWRSQS